MSPGFAGVHIDMYQVNYSVLQLRWKIIFPFLAKSRAHAHTLLYKVCVWARDFARNGKNNFPTQLQYTVSKVVPKRRTGPQTDPDQEPVCKGLLRRG